MNIKKVVVAGGGVLGSQIAFQSAYWGFDVTIWLRSEGSIKRTQPKIDHLRETYLADIEKMKGATPDSPSWCRGLADGDSFDAEKAIERTEAAYKNIKLELDMKKAVDDADLVIESMAEEVDAKVAFYKALAPLLPAKTVLVTNSSTSTSLSTLQTPSGRTTQPKSWFRLRLTTSILMKLANSLTPSI